MDLIGLPIQVIAGPRSVAENQVELKNRLDGSRVTVTIEEAINQLSGS